MSADLKEAVLVKAQGGGDGGGGDGGGDGGDDGGSGGEGGGGSGALSGEWGGGEGGGGEGGGAGGGEGGGGEGMHVPQVEKYALAKAVLSTHAQMVMPLFKTDREFAPCRVKREGLAEKGSTEVGRREGVGRGDARSGQGWTQLWRVRARARAERT